MFLQEAHSLADAQKQWNDNFKGQLFFSNEKEAPAESKEDIIEKIILKEMHNSFKKWPLNLWWIWNKTLMKVGNITKAATFKSFFHLSYKNTQLLFFVTVLLNIFMRQTWDNDFWGLHKNMNCTFPLSCWTKTVIKKDVFNYRSSCWKWKLLAN